MVLGALTCVVGAGASAIRTGSPVLAAIALSFVLITIFRYVAMTAFLRADIGPTDVEAAVTHQEQIVRLRRRPTVIGMLHEGSSEPTGEVMKDGGKVALETGFDWEVVRELLRKGHVVGFNNGDYGGYQAIRVDVKTHTYFGASESRKDGMAAGY